MDTLWAKFKLWTKLLIVGVLAVVFIFFLYGNWNEHVSRLDLVFHQWTNVRLLTLIFFTAVVSIFGWWLFWTLFRTIRQVRGLRDRSRTQKLEREVAEMKAKAQMLQVKPDTKES